jgi:hypothetical protein
MKVSRGALNLFKEIVYKMSVLGGKIGVWQKKQGVCKETVTHA